MKTIPVLLVFVFGAILGGVYAETAIRLSEVADDNAAKATPMTLTYKESSETLWVKDAPIITQQDMEDASAFRQDEEDGVTITLTPEGAQKFKDGIKDMKGKRLAIIINGFCPGSTRN